MKTLKARSKINLLIDSELTSLINYKNKIIINHILYKKKDLPLFFYIKEISFYLKKNLQIIHEYNTIKKRFLLIGKEKIWLNDQNFYFNLKKMNHTFLPEDIWMNGFISNRYHVVMEFFRHEKRRVAFEDIKIKPEFVISYSDKYNLINSECYNKKILHLNLNTHSEFKDYYSRKSKIPDYFYIPTNFSNDGLFVKKKFEIYFYVLIKKLLLIHSNNNTKRIANKKHFYIPKKKHFYIPKKKHKKKHFNHSLPKPTNSLNTKRLDVSKK